MTRCAAFAWAVVLVACTPSGDPTPQTGSQTNWLIACDSVADCGELDCVCGACTASCDGDGDGACTDLQGASCVAASDEGVLALCGGAAPERGVCLPRCEASCETGTSCVHGVCLPDGIGAVRVTIEPSVRHQTLAGFGASLAYADDAIVAHPQKASLYDLLFLDAGLDAIRIRNRYEGAVAPPLAPAQEIIGAASERLGHMPFVFMTSGTPPASLKASGSRLCAGSPETCTLASLPAGGFDYVGFGRFWRESLEYYAGAGLLPDYVSIQNHPNWVPAATAPGEACRFLPEEGTQTLDVDGMPVEVALAGHREALEAVREATADLPVPPRFAAPEVTGPLSVSEYVSALGSIDVDALATHLYGVDPANVDIAALEAVRDLAYQRGRPVVLSEMQARGLDTAVLMHHALTAADAIAYMQNDLVALTTETAEVSLVLLTEGGLAPQAPYYAMRHFAKDTAPGWVRVDAESASSELLSSAWLSPDGSALTVVLVNPTAQQHAAQLALPDALRARISRTRVTRTAFDDVERGTELGALPETGTVQVPAHAVVTVAFDD